MTEHKRCASCDSTFTPSAYQNQHHRLARGDDSKRVPAAYCSNACRQAAYRKRASGCPKTPMAGCDTAFSVGFPALPATTLAATVTQPDLRRQKAYPGGASVVPDSKYAGLYRVRYPDGTLSDMTNLSRAKDAARAV